MWQNMDATMALRLHEQDMRAAVHEVCGNRSVEVAERDRSQDAVATVQTFAVVVRSLLSVLRSHRRPVG